MKILIVDNNKNDVVDFIVLIDNFNDSQEIELTFKVEYNYDRVLEIVNDFDFALIDIELDNNTNGIDLACKIRENNKDIKLIFISNFSKYLIDGYKAKADLYLLKPVTQNEFNKAIFKLSKEYIFHHAGITDFRYSPKKIYFHDILYIEALSRKLYIHFKNGKTFVNNDSLTKWELLLKEYPFSHPHRSFLVNMEHIDTFNKKEVRLVNQSKLPITEHYFNQFCQDYMRYLNRRS